MIESRRNFLKFTGALMFGFSTGMYSWLRFINGGGSIESLSDQELIQILVEYPATHENLSSIPMLKVFKEAFFRLFTPVPVSGDFPAPGAEFSHKQNTLFIGNGQVDFVAEMRNDSREDPYSVMSGVVSRSEAGGWRVSVINEPLGMDKDIYTEELTPEVFEYAFGHISAEGFPFSSDTLSASSIRNILVAPKYIKSYGDTAVHALAITESMGITAVDDYPSLPVVVNNFGYTIAVRPIGLDENGDPVQLGQFLIQYLTNSDLQGGLESSSPLPAEIARDLLYLFDTGDFSSSPLFNALLRDYISSFIKLDKKRSEEGNKYSSWIMAEEPHLQAKKGPFLPGRKSLVNES